MKANKSNVGRCIGTYDFEVLDESGIVIARRKTRNLITTEGANLLWQVMFAGVAASDPWYVGLIGSVPTPALAITDTLASTPGWDELIPGTDYTGNRQAWDDAAAASRTKTSATNAAFPILTTKTVYGAFLCNAATGTTGTLFSEGAFSVALPVIAGNTVNVVYSVQLA